MSPKIDGSPGRVHNAQIHRALLLALLSVSLLIRPPTKRVRWPIPNREDFRGLTAVVRQDPLWVNYGNWRRSGAKVGLERIVGPGSATKRHSIELVRKGEFPKW
jgi:hypothetical protein